MAAYNLADAKPIGDAHYGSEIARILNTVKHYREVVPELRLVQLIARYVVDGHHFGRSGEVAHALHVGTFHRHRLHGADFGMMTLNPCRCGK